MGSLSNLAGRDGITEVLPPGERGAQEAQRLPRACGALQDAIYFLSGVRNKVVGKWGRGTADHTARLVHSPASGTVLLRQNPPVGGKRPEEQRII